MNAATSILNQGINTLKFYYGILLKNKFICEVKRPRKEKKLSVILIKENFEKILSSVDNIKKNAILIIICCAILRVRELIKLNAEDKYIGYNMICVSYKRVRQNCVNNLIFKKEKHYG